MQLNQQQKLIQKKSAKQKNQHSLAVQKCHTVTQTKKEQDQHTFAIQNKNKTRNNEW